MISKSQGETRGDTRVRAHGLIALFVVAMIVTSLAPVVAAEAQAGAVYTWRGTIAWVVHEKHEYSEPYPGSTLFDASYELSNFVPEAEGSFRADVKTSGYYEDRGRCSSDETYPIQVRHTQTWETQSLTTTRPVIWFNDDGEESPNYDGDTTTRYRLRLGQLVPVVGTDSYPSTRCNDASSQSEFSVPVAISHPASQAELYIRDEHEAPDRLVGQRTWTLSDLPYTVAGSVHASSLTEYSLSLEYDLTLVETCASDETERSVSTSFLAHFVSVDTPGLLRYKWSDLRFCYGSGPVKVISSGTRAGERADGGAITTALETLGMKFKYDGSGKVTKDPLTDGSLEAVVKGRFEICTQIPFAGPIISKGLRIIAKIVPNWIEKKLASWATEKIFRSGLIPDSIKNKIVREGFEAVLRSIDDLSAGERAALKKLFDKAVDRVRGDFIDLFLGDGVCFNAWSPEVKLRLKPDGSYESAAYGTTGLFEVVQEF